MDEGTSNNVDDNLAAAPSAAPAPAATTTTSTAHIPPLCFKDQVRDDEDEILGTNPETTPTRVSDARRVAPRQPEAVGVPILDATPMLLADDQVIPEPEPRHANVNNNNNNNNSKQADRLKELEQQVEALRRQIQHQQQQGGGGGGGEGSGGEPTAGTTPVPSTMETPPRFIGGGGGETTTLTSHDRDGGQAVSPDYDDDEPATTSRNSSWYRSSSSNFSLKNREAKVLCGVGVVGLLAVAVIAGLCGTDSHCHGNRGRRIPTSSSTETTIHDPSRNGAILDYLNAVTLNVDAMLTYPAAAAIDDGDVTTTMVAANMAVRWLIEEDGIVIVDNATATTTVAKGSEVALVQRYVLATLWYQSGGVFHKPEHVATWTRPNLDECDWHDVSCDGSGRVTHLFLESVGIRGRLPVDLGLLSSALLELGLNLNELTGPIPSALGQLTALTILGLRGNALTGTVPSEIGRLTKLTGMTVSDNLLNGTIPSALGDLTNLARLLMWDNQFTGTIPSALGALTALSELWLQRNQLTGTMPFCDDGIATKIGGRQQHNFTTLVAECGEVVCPCCTHCCPTSEEFGLPGFTQC